MDPSTTNFIQSLIDAIEARIELLRLDRSRTPPVKKQQRLNNIIITWNIFSTDDSLEDLLTQFYKEIKLKLKEVVGEIIHFQIETGEISDTGLKEFIILSGHSWEIYIYSPETFIYLRLLLEAKKANPDEQWISIDIDIVTESAWFFE